MQSFASFLAFSQYFLYLHRPRFPFGALHVELDQILAWCLVLGACRHEPLRSQLASSQRGLVLRSTEREFLSRPTQLARWPHVRCPAHVRPPALLVLLVPQSAAAR